MKIICRQNAHQNHVNKNMQIMCNKCANHVKIMCNKYAHGPKPGPGPQNLRGPGSGPGPCANFGVRARAWAHVHICCIWCLHISCAFPAHDLRMICILLAYEFHIVFTSFSHFNGSPKARTLALHSWDYKREWNYKREWYDKREWHFQREWYVKSKYGIISPSMGFEI